MSNNIHAPGSDNAQKKRKIQRACDACRRKKIRCYGVAEDGVKCANCISYKEECSYNDLAKKRYSSREYVDLLEERMRNMEALLQKMSPATNLTQELQKISDENSLRPSPAQLSVSASETQTSTLGQSPEESQYLSSDEEDPVENDLTAALQKLEINPAFPRFLGKSSAATLVKAAMKMKSDVLGAESPNLPTIVKAIQGRRPEIFRTHPWEQKEHETSAAIRLQQYVFPEPDLLPTLIECYFHELNTIYPILHRPSFKRYVTEGLHLRDDGFAKVLLVVCSIGARFVNDPRVNINGGSAHSAGWKWYNQVQFVRQTFQGVRLYEVQLYALAAIFIISSSTPHAGWSLAGTGLRLALEVGAHRRKMYSSKDPLSSDLWKRVFWVLVCLDRNFSMVLGQPCSIHDEDFDVGLPMIVDDEHWEHPGDLPSPPPALADLSPMAGFICLTKLYQILAFALRTIYSINKSKVLYGFTGPEWEQKVVSDLDSALNKWNDTIPDHLRWGHPDQDDTSFHVSASLFLTYHQIQIIVHRPFIPTTNRQGTLASSALAMCTSAARSISRILDAHFKRRQHALPIQLPAASIAGMILFLSIWGGIRAGVTSNPQKVMEDVYKCMDYLKYCEPHWHIASRGYMILYELVAASNLPLPAFQPEASMKRRRDETEEANVNFHGGSPSSSQYGSSVSSSDSPALRAMNQPHQVRSEWPDSGLSTMYSTQPELLQPSWQPSFDVPSDTSAAPSAMPNDIGLYLSQLDSAGWAAGVGVTNPFDHMFEELFQTTPPSDHTSPAGSTMFNELDEILYSGSLPTAANYPPPQAQTQAMHQIPWAGVYHATT